jgi:hypothetical protein
MTMSAALWRLLLKDPAGLSCGECFVVLEFSGGLLVEGGSELLPEVLKHLVGCPV